MTEKVPKPPAQKNEKNICSQPEIVFLAFKALCSKTDFSYISEKEVASLFKNGHFKNVQFRKTHEQIYSTVFMWAIIYGNPIYMKYIMCKTTNA